MFLFTSTKVDSSIVEEISKDVSRLETVTDRFSKIGSDPKFENVSVKATMDNVIDYLRLRISDKIKIEIEGDEEYYLNLCVPLLNG